MQNISDVRLESNVYLGLKWYLLIGKGLLLFFFTWFSTPFCHRYALSNAALIRVIDVNKLWLHFLPLHILHPILKSNKNWLKKVRELPCEPMSLGGRAGHFFIRPLRNLYKSLEKCPTALPIHVRISEWFVFWFVDLEVLVLG